MAYLRGKILPVRQGLPHALGEIDVIVKKPRVYRVYKVKVARTSRYDAAPRIRGPAKQARL
jgi:Holliday junction resolvase-like predicted endonuclease